MAATSKQVNSYVYYISNYDIKRAMIVGTVTSIVNDQEDRYLLEGEGNREFLDSTVFDLKADCITYCTNLINALP